jgi:hypothetical protein
MHQHLFISEFHPLTTMKNLRRFHFMWYEIKFKGDDGVLQDYLDPVLGDFCLLNMPYLKNLSSCLDIDNMLTHNLAVFKEVCDFD